MTTQKDTLKKLLNGASYQVVAYHSYPIGYLDHNVLQQCDTDKLPTTEDDPKLVKLVVDTHKDALHIITGRANPQLDNKSAVEVRITGTDKSIFLGNHDGVCFAATQIQDRGGKKYELNTIA